MRNTVVLVSKGPHHEEINVNNSENRPKVKLIGEDGNAFNIMGLCKRAAKRAGWSEERIDALLKDMKSGNYDHLLGVVMREFDVE
jgi:hypothetical protein